MADVIPQDVLGMSDEEFSNLNDPVDTDSSEGEGNSGNVPPAGDTSAETAPSETEADSTPDSADGETSSDASADGEVAAQPQAGQDGGNPSGSTADEQTPDSIKPVVDLKSGVENYAALPPETKATLFDEIMKPFKANGKMIELRNPQEAIQLMQMGANYTRKLQDLQPHRKVLMMLDNNGLLDESRLSFLIDLDRRDPEAIKKLLKDSGIDPLDINADAEPNYVAGSHAVSDTEANFRMVLDELSSNPTGPETLRVINSRWDQASKEIIWQSPEIMTVIHEQREQGIYDVIAAEVDRRMTLGMITAGTPFLQAYKTVGDEMAHAAMTANGGQAHNGSPAATGHQPEILGTKVVAPKSPVTNGDQAKAASSTRTSPKTAEVKLNPLAMSDDDFLKQMENRL